MRSVNPSDVRDEDLGEDLSSLCIDNHGVADSTNDLDDVCKASLTQSVRQRECAHLSRETDGDPILDRLVARLRHFKIARASAIEVVAAYELAEALGESVPRSAVEQIATAFYAMLTRLIRPRPRS
jgi:hypothetical protein